MKLIIRWNLIVGIILIAIGFIQLFDWMIKDFAEVSYGTTALTRIIVGAAMIMIAMGFYKVDRR